MNPGSQRGVRLAMGALGLCGVLALAVALIGLNLPPLLILALATAGVALPIFVLRPEAGLHLLILLIYFESLGESDRKLTVGKLAGALIILAWLLGVAVSRRLNLRFNGLVIAMFAFVGWSAFGIQSAFNGDVAIRQTLTYLQLVIALIMVGSVVDTMDKVTRLLRAIVWCTTLAGVYGLALYAAGRATTTAGIVVNRNAMGNYAAFAIACAYLLYQASDSALERLALAAAIPTLFVTLALTFSRTGVIEASVIVAVIGLRLARRQGFLLLFGTLVMLLIISFLLPTRFYDRVESIGPSMQHQEETFGQRVELVQAASRMIEAHPILGVGAGNFTEVVTLYGRSGFTLSGHLASHNTFMGVAAESGIPGLMLFLAAVGFAFRSLWTTIRVSRHGDPRMAFMAIAVEASLVGLMVAGLSGNQEKTKFLYIFLGLVLSLEGIRLRSPAPVGAAAAPREVPAMRLPAVTSR